MVKMVKQILITIACCIVLISNVAFAKHQRITHPDWALDVKVALNDFLNEYGIDSQKYILNSYVVFDFDKSTSINDVQYQLLVYQIESMAFAMNPQTLKTTLLTDITDVNTSYDLSTQKLGKGSAIDRVNDIVSDYQYLWDNYGPFLAKGLSQEKQDIIHGDPYWADFAARLHGYVNFVYDTLKLPTYWQCNLYNGMSEEEAYNLAFRSHSKYKNVPTSQVTWSTCLSNKRSGEISSTFMNGITVTDNICELWSALKDNGIDVWVCSASGVDEIRAAVDAFGLHPYCKGILAMTNNKPNGVYTTGYDWETGYGYYCYPDNKWKKMLIPEKSAPVGKGKVQCIENTLEQEYKHGPLAGFMDSTGDFNFCTEFKDLKLVVCFNYNNAVTSGSGLVSEVAMYQRDFLNYDLFLANENGDTLYVLQGVDDNNPRKLRPSNESIVWGATKSKLFASENHWRQLFYMVKNKMNTAHIFNTFAFKADKGNSKLGFEYGFLDTYNGYHSHD
ncbi:MAG: hypothetical protein KBS60_06615 [Phascolarctobacterium sp.]|nr:hypothetical protein [Candidatus Phascolarctobacterium caballi]